MIQNHPLNQAIVRTSTSRESRKIRSWALLSIFFLLFLAPAVSAQEEVSEDQIKFFESKIRPMLIERCYECHSGALDEVESKFQIDSRAGILKGGIHGAAAIPGMPEKSLMIFAVNHAVNMDMPPKFKMPQTEIDDLTAWVKMGLPWPDSEAVANPENGGEADPGVVTDEDRQFWSFKRPIYIGVPRVENAGWARNEIDYFVLHQLETAGMHPARPASKRDLIRRATFDLTGLPPTPEQVQAFLADTSPNAYEQLIDRLLGSPAYGQRWGRHWLDVARYADSNGLDENLCHGFAFRYRDYVVDAFNKDKTYDQFLTEQLAGDLIDDANTTSTVPERITATGFLSIGAKMLAEDDPMKMQMDIIDEQVDTLGRAFMGLTFGCARCHDHKFDPIPTADYYSLAGIFKSTTTMDNFNVVAKWHERPVANAELNKKTEEIQKQIDQVTAKANDLRNRGVEVALKNARSHVAAYLLSAKSFDSMDTLLPASRTFGNDAMSLESLNNQLIEAEAFARGDVQKQLGEGDSPYSLIHGDGEEPGFAEYDIKTDEDGLYQIELRFATAEKTETTLLVDGEVKRLDVTRGITGGIEEAHQYWANVLTLDLTAGDHVIRLESKGRFPYLDKLRILHLSGDLAAVGKDEAAQDIATTAVDLTQSVSVEAETFDRGNVTRLKTGYGLAIGAIAGAAGSNDMEYDITLPKPGAYHLVTRYAAADARSAEFKVGDQIVNNMASPNVTGTWNPDTQHWEYQGSFETSETNITFKVHRDGPIPHYDRFLFIPTESIKHGDYTPDPTILRKWRTVLAESKTVDGSVFQLWHRALETGFPIELSTDAGDIEKALLSDGAVTDFAKLADRYQRVFQLADAQGQQENSIALEAFREQLYADDGPYGELDAGKLTLAMATTDAIAAAEMERADLEKTKPDVPFAMAVEDGAPEDLRIHIRGNHITLGDQVPRRFPEVLSVGNREAIDKSRSGRLDLAQWLTSEEHPLTSRVMANRLWQWHVGEGLVRSPDNFGRLGLRPTHPELLDFLAIRFQELGWSMKEMHRLIMFSSTYRMSSEWNQEYDARDPENKLIWRMPRRRLSAEEIRDALLAVGNNIDLSFGGTLLPTPNRAYVTSTANVDVKVYETRRRSIYLPVVRSALYSMFQVFDFAEPSVPQGQRQTTNIASQALFIMNSKIVIEQAEALAQDVLTDESMEDEARVDKLFMKLFGRVARDGERLSCLSHIDQYQKALAESDVPAEVHVATSWQSLCRALLASNEFIYLD